MTWLACLAALVYFLPEHVAAMLGQSQAAWEYVAYGVEAALLWLAVGLSVRGFPLRFVSLFGFFEAMQRPVCRLCFPMDRAPKLPQGQTLCDVALSLPTILVSVPAALFAAALAQEVMCEKGR